MYQPFCRGLRNKDEYVLAILIGSGAVSDVQAWFLDFN